MMHQKLQDLLDKVTDQKKVFGSLLFLDTPTDSISISSGDLPIDTSFFIASVTKLYTAAIIFKLVENNILSLEDTLHTYFTLNEISQLSNTPDINEIKDITIKQLLSHTSGLPDYFEGKSDGSVLSKDILAGKDRSWTFSDVLNKTKKMNLSFSPNTKGKASYSDTNYQLLGQIIEKVCNNSYEWAVNNYIVQSLGLNYTYVYTDIHDVNPKDMYYKNKQLHVPKAMSSFQADGGIVSTLEEMMTFIKAFYQGRLFSKDIFNDMEFNKLFFPIKYGLGMMKYNLPRVFTGFKKLPDIIGHSGVNGAFAFYAPDIETFIVGTVNQTDNPGRPFRLLTNILMLLQNKTKATYRQHIGNHLAQNELENLTYTYIIRQE